AWEPFFADMRAATGMPVQGWYAESYLDAADALVTNTVQLAWVSSKTATPCWLARCRPAPTTPKSWSV
ncbi:MAG: hypothetical protein H7Y33_04425, partial [Cytophagales bacterium]|nr:hypothetical protein [Rhizobacter sp.]